MVPLAGLSIDAGSMTFAPVIFFSLPLPPPPPLSLPHAATNAARHTANNAASPTRSLLLRPDIKLSLLVPQRPGQRPLQRARDEWKQIRLPSALRCPIARRTLHPNAGSRKNIWRA